MTKTMRLTLTTALALALAGPALAETTWRMATKMPVDSPEGQVFAKFAELTEEYTDGELKIDVFPNEQLGKEDAVLEQLQANIIQVYAEGFGYMKKWEPALAWVAAAFAFDDYDHWQRFMTSETVTGWFDNAAEQSGVRPLGDPTQVLRGPYRVMVSNVPIESAADIAGVKLRMHENKVAIETWDHLGAEVITLPWTEVYQGISKSIVQAVNSPIALVESMRFNEVAPYITRHDEYWQSIGFMVNEQALAALDEETRAGLLKAYEEAGDYSQEVMFGVAEESIARMEEAGATFSVLDTAPLVEKMQSFYDDMAAQGELPEGFMAAVEASRASGQ
ncbi:MULTISPECIES: TRAP transporter substrate-binding protein [Marinovum]|jgi:TRAP-type C4-dicarboxylate transport system substrate-binding protein|uniref:TRAP-type C4-dicarboxylate transport system, substrate-binding protein n=1 Tax=Marinovum algicola TaxID=42444 RepID=A0A975ZQ21_9RHOB|nr:MULTISPECIES: TRAP transporter substrate-binding protein [Marinovum]AKO99321.1 TRAP-type C4-dicarboxylate transport system, periplasmic component [Marinovum algicola DG 898]MDD9740927.1 TRAP transporter substrate-binding protein [Marinovum sp. SP66]SEJ99961.1 TRAP-type C4-dicarboxylate transport system, substrate-binding protein [Marinovum algicola]SLN73304.1 C4-dicarboxylate-binding periplasmic protein precursor [Marinovum algicola]